MGDQRPVRGGSLRLFVAIRVDRPLVREVERWRGELPVDIAGAKDVRWVRSELLHVTVVFLGDVPGESVPSLERALVDAAGRTPAFTLQSTGLGWFPPGGRRMRVLWVGFEASGVLTKLHRRLCREIRSRLATPLDERSFHAHLTIARFRRSWPRSRLRSWSARWRPIPAFAVSEIELVASELGPGGPKYRRLAAVALSSGVGGSG